MLRRHKIILSLLDQIKKPISRTVFVKFVFLLDQETLIKNDETFYDFVPYQFGPFSFALYHEVNRLEEKNLVALTDNSIGLCHSQHNQILPLLQDLSKDYRLAIGEMVTSYKKYAQADLLKLIYKKYPWFAINSQLKEYLPPKLPRKKVAKPAIYTVGYEGMSVDRFFNHLLKIGIKAIIDVRSNPISRKYGFSKRSLGDNLGKIGIAYHHIPELGIESKKRVDLDSFESYQILLDEYQNVTLPKRTKEIDDLRSLISEAPAALLCYENNVACCHRGRLSQELANNSELDIIHI